MRVRFTDEALAKLHAIHDHGAADSPKAAARLIDRLTRRAERIGEHPNAGREVPEYRIEVLREVLARPYRIIYRITTDEIQIATVMHYRQLLPQDLA